jgi:hypothetical protein
MSPLQRPLSAPRGTLPYRAIDARDVEPKRVRTDRGAVAPDDEGQRRAPAAMAPAEHGKWKRPCQQVSTPAPGERGSPGRSPEDAVTCLLCGAPA